MILKRKTLLYSMFCIFFIFLLFQKVYAIQIEYGDKIDVISTIDTSNRQVVIPSKEKVTVLVFFNSNSPSHLRTVEKFNELFMIYVRDNEPIEFFAVSMNSDKKSIRSLSQLNIKIPFINDTENKFISLFNFECGACMKVVVFDKSGFIRFNASYINLPIVKEIIDRYLDKVK